MSQYQIAVVIGSLRRDSYNRQLANTLKRPASEGFSFRDLRIDDLPLYNHGDDGNQAASLKRLKNESVAADGDVFVTPEYSRTVPGVLKNASDHASRAVWAERLEGHASVIGASIGVPGISMAQQHLRNILAYLDVLTFEQPQAANSETQAVPAGLHASAYGLGQLFRGKAVASICIVRNSVDRSTRVRTCLQ